MLCLFFSGSFLYKTNNKKETPRNKEGAFLVIENSSSGPGRTLNNNSQENKKNRSRFVRFFLS